MIGITSLAQDASQTDWHGGPECQMLFGILASTSSPDRHFGRHYGKRRTPLFVAAPRRRCNVWAMPETRFWKRIIREGLHSGQTDANLGGNGVCTWGQTARADDGRTHQG